MKFWKANEWGITMADGHKYTGWSAFWRIVVLSPVWVVGLLTGRMTVKK